MLKRKSTLLTLAIVLALSVVFNVGALALDTQFKYKTYKPAWLDSLMFSEDMTTVDGIMNNQLNFPLIPQLGVNKYAHTAESFADEVDRSMELYGIDKLTSEEKAVSYLYVIEQLNEFSVAMKNDVSDEFIRAYLENAGIVYPADGEITTETLILARALYSLMTGSPDVVKVPVGATIAGAFVYLAGDLTDTDLSSLEKIDSNVLTIETMTEYMMMMGKLALINRGYEVSADSTEDDIVRNLAIMIVEIANISIDAETAGTDEIKDKYMAAMLGMMYDVALDPALLKGAIIDNRVPFYILQAIGLQENITVKDSMSYNEAFLLIAENTNHFALENEFLADVYNYTTTLAYKRDKVWVNAKALQKTDAKKGQTVAITINGISSRDGYYTEVPMDKSKTSQEIVIRVQYIKGQVQETETYKILVYQGETDAPDNGNSLLSPQVTDPNSDSMLSPIIDAFNGLFSSSDIDVPQTITNVVSQIVPSFGGSAATATEVEGEGSGFMDKIAGALGGFALVMNPAAVQPDDAVKAGALGGVGGIDVAIATGAITQPNFNSVSGSGNSGYIYSNPLARGIVTASLRHISEMGPAPEGTAYVTDANGYVLGLSVENDIYKPVINTVLPDIGLPDNESAVVTFAKSNMPLLILSAIAIVTMTSMIVIDRKKKKAGKSGSRT